MENDITLLSAKRHYSQVTQFFRPIGTDTEKLLEYSTAPRLYANHEGRRLSKAERDRLIKELETELQGKTYMSTIDDLEEIDMLLEDRFSLLCLLYTSPSPRDLSTSRMPSSA